MDIPGLEATASFPLNPTASFPPPGGDAPTEPSPGAPQYILDPDLPRIPGYRVLRVVGGGGMGTVFEALHLATNRTVALKLINAGWVGDSDFRARFAREVTTLAALEHPNVVPVYDAGSWHGLPYLTMKFVAGKTLHHHLAALRRDPRAACELLVKVARAVHYLHSKGIVHRDLKPLNILIAPEGTPLVADFGLVRPIDDDSNLSVTQIPLGTRQYMSPEQTRGGRENYTFACDIWALGVILYELLAGARPFNHDDPVELFRQIRHDPVPPIPLEAGAPPGLEAIARRCLEKSPADRYQSSEEVATDLERWLAGEEIPLPPPAPTPVVTVSAPIESPRRAHRGYRGLLAAVAMAALLGFSGGTPQAPPVPGEAPKPRTVGERLRAGEVVWVAREKGPLRIEYRVLPGTHGAPTTEVDGYLTLTSAGMLAVEFVTDPLPPSVRLEGEVALVISNNANWSFAGVYGGGKETPTANGPQQTLVLLAQANSVLREGEVERMTENATLELHRWGAVAPRDRSALGSKSHTTEIVPGKAEVQWRGFALDVTPGRISGTWRGGSVGGVAGDFALKDMNGSYGLEFRTKESPFQPPAFGPGLGLCVHNATAVFRNVRLVPPQP